MRNVVVAMTMLILLAGGIYTAGWSGIFSIKTISCQVDHENECSAELKAELDRYLNKNLLAIRPKRIENRIISIERLSQSARVEPDFPASLRVNITSRRAMVAITTAENSKEAVEVDKDGVILRQISDSHTLPRLIWVNVGRWPIEEMVPQGIIKAMRISVLAAEGFKLTRAPEAADESSLVMKLNSGERVWLSLERDPVGELARLQVVLNQVKIEGKAVKEIDMRFENPVIR